MEITLIHNEDGIKHEAAVRYRHKKRHSYVYRQKINGCPYDLPKRRCRKVADDPKEVMRALSMMIKAQMVMLEYRRPARHT